MIEATIAHDKQLNSLSEFSQLLYLKILPHTDDYGRFEGDPEILKARVDPLSKRSISHYEKSLLEISGAGLWFIYETNTGKQIIQYKEDTFERINAFLIKKRGKSEYEEYMDLYKVISGDITYKVISIKHKEESIKIGGCGGIFQHPLQQYISENFETVKKLKLPSVQMCKTLTENYSDDIIIETLNAMENYKPLLKKYKDSGLTLHNWIKLRTEKANNGKHIKKTASGFDPLQFAKRKAELDELFKKVKGGNIS